MGPASAVQPEKNNGHEASQRRLNLLRAALIILAGFWVFAPALRGDWLMDDDFYLTQNALLGDSARLWKTWFVPGSLVEYYPVEASVQFFQWQLWHLDTRGYHLTNLVLHVLGALLVWRLLSKFGLRLAWLGGLLFVVHPAVVESVAWISELKNTLSLPPFLLAMCAWIDYQVRGRPRDYFLALGLFLLAMLCKISMALFPLVILLYAWWKRDRVVWKDVATALPFFAVSIVLGLTTIAAGNWFREAHLQPTAPPGIGSWPVHLALAGLSMTHYFSKVVWPFGLMPIYPLWKINPPMLIQFLPWPVWAGIVYWLWTQRTGWGRHALLGLGFFLINLLPFVGFTSVSYMAYTWVMDHFLYLPMIGLIGLAVAALDWTEYRISVAARPAFAGIVAAVFALLAWESHQYAGIFIGQEKLWTFTIEHNPKSWLAHNNLGNVLLETGRVPQAIAEYQQALRFDPHMVEANNNLGLALEQTGHPAEAIRHYQDALKYNPHFPLALINLGDALSQQGRIQEAIDPYTQALKINPNNADVRSNLGLVLIEAGRLPEAQEQFQAVLRLDPNSANARKNLARIDSMQKAAHPQP